MGIHYINKIKTNEEYIEIKNYLKHSILPAFNNRMTKNRFIKKSNHFILIGELLYKKETCNNHKRVIAEDDIETMKFEIKIQHEKHHFGYNKMEAYLNEHYFSILRSVVREVCKSCLICQRSEPLNRTLPIINIIAKTPRERYQIN